jgi:chromate transporter
MVAAETLMQALLFGAQAISLADWLSLLTHFLMLSLLAVGGAITTAPDMHRFVVRDQGWLSDAQFTGSVALAQAAPGPNVLFVAVIGFNVAGLAGVLATVIGTLLPSTALALTAGRYSEKHRSSRAVRAFTTGMAPLTIGLLLASGWILLEPARAHIDTRWQAAALVLVTVITTVRSKIGPLWLIGLGALAGVLGWV